MQSPLMTGHPVVAWLYATDTISVASNYTILELQTVDYNSSRRHSKVRIHPSNHALAPTRTHTDGRVHRVLVQAAAASAAAAVVVAAPPPPLAAATAAHAVPIAAATLHHHHAAFHDVPEFPHISGPGMPDESVEYLLRDLYRLAL